MWLISIIIINIGWILYVLAKLGVQMFMFAFSKGALVDSESFETADLGFWKERIVFSSLNGVNGDG